MPDPSVSFGDWVRSRMFDQRTVLISGELDTTLADLLGHPARQVRGECARGRLAVDHRRVELLQLVHRARVAAASLAGQPFEQVGDPAVDVLLRGVPPSPRSHSPPP